MLRLHVSGYLPASKTLFFFLPTWPGCRVGRLVVFNKQAPTASIISVCFLLAEAVALKVDECFSYHAVYWSLSNNVTCFPKEVWGALGGLDSGNHLSEHWRLNVNIKDLLVCRWLSLLENVLARFIIECPVQLLTGEEFLDNKLLSSSTDCHNICVKDTSWRTQ